MTHFAKVVEGTVVVDVIVIEPADLNDFSSN